MLMLLTRTLKSIIHANVFLAICFMAYTYANFVLNGITVSWPYLGFIGCSTLLVYNLHRLLGLKLNLPVKLQVERFAFVYNYRPQIKLLILLSWIATLIFTLLLPIKLVLWLVPAGAISALYILPIFKRDGIRYRVRDLPYIKMFLIAIVSVYSCAVIPVMTYSKALNMWLLLAQFLWFISLTLPFDMRDVALDKTEGISTFGILLSAFQFKLAMAILIFTSLSLYALAESKIYLMVGGFSLLHVAIAVLITPKRTDDIFYALGYEGAMLTFAVSAFIYAYFI